MNPGGSCRHDVVAEPTITGVITVAVPVSDQDVAVKMFQRLGLQVRLDAQLQPGFRWIEMGLPGGGATISLVRTGSDLPAGIDTGIRLATADAHAAHRAVRDLGLDAGDLLDWDTAPLMFSFADADGNRFYVTEASD